MSTGEATDKELHRREQNERDWVMVIAAMKRAIEWVEKHRQHLQSFSLRLQPSQRTGVCVDLGFSDEEDKRAASLKALFAGKRVVKTTNSERTSTAYQLHDEELNLTFHWTVWVRSTSSRKQPIVENVVI